MSYKIVIDSCGELPEELKKDTHFQHVPLGLEVGDYQILDDENFDQKEFLQKVAACKTCPKSSCPSPEKYMEAYHTDAENVYATTLSANLSGSYNSAVLGMNLYHETYGEKNIHIVDSCSASCGETQIALLAQELEEEGTHTFEEIVERLETYRDEMHTYFILDNLETLRKNGRLSGVKALVASTLSIKPVMGANNEGVILQLSQAIGMKKAIQKMVDIVVKEAGDSASKRVMITHCNCPERAQITKEALEKKAQWKEIIIMDTAGISSMYANDGGIILTV
ncbi:MAG: DegV family protein [Lachnospiraceae bacterium]|nr:DegV family protein [Lachnospiraceae bacterium]